MQFQPEHAGLSPELLDRLAEADDRATRPATDQLSQVLEEVHDRALPTRIGDFARWLRFVPDNSLTAVLSVVVACTWPYLLNLAAWALPLDLAYTDAARNAFALSAVAICLTMLAISRLLRATSVRIGRSLSELVPAAKDQAELGRWLRASGGVRRQLAVGVAAGAVAVAIVAQTFNVPSKANFMLYALSGWHGFVAGATLPWLLTGAAIPRRLMRCERLRMVWIDPASTPAIRHLCRYYAYTAAGLAVTVLVCEVVAVLYASQRESAAADNFVVVLPIAAAALAVYVGIWPYVWTARLVRKQIDHTLDPVRAQMVTPPRTLLTGPGFEELVKVYQYFSTLKALPIKTSALPQYVAGIGASLVVYLVQKYVD